MAESTPTQTWNQGDIVGISTYTAAAYLAALKTAIDASTHYEVLDDAADQLLIGPSSASSPVADMRFVFGGSATTTISSGQRFYTSSAASNVQNSVFAGISPDSGRSTFLNNWDDASGPLGTDRFSPYMLWTHSSTQCDGLWIVECAEMLQVWLRRLSSNTVFGGVIGAVVEPGIDAGGDSSGDPRLYGGFAAGINGLPVSSNFWTSSSSGNTLHAASSFTSGQPVAFVFTPGSNTVETIFRGTLNAAVRSHTTKNEAQYFEEVRAQRTNNSGEMVGKWRQMCVSSYAAPRAELTVSGTTKAIAVGSDFDITGAALWMVNP